MASLISKKAELVWRKYAMENLDEEIESLNKIISSLEEVIGSK